MREADVLVHVVDISHPNFEDHIHVVNQMLTELNAADKPTLLVFNKIDAFTYIKKDDDDLTPSTRENISLDDLKKTWMAKGRTKNIFISASKKENIKELRDLLLQEVKRIHQQRYPNQPEYT